MIEWTSVENKHKVERWEGGGGWMDKISWLVSNFKIKGRYILDPLSLIKPGELQWQDLLIGHNFNL